MGDSRGDPGVARPSSAQTVASIVLLLWMVGILYHFYTKMGFLTLVADLIGGGGR